MNKEVYVEQMIKKGTAQSDLRRRLFLVAGAVLILVIVAILGYNAVILAGPVVFMAVALMLWILWRRVAQEFEYTYTEGYLEIDVVFSRSSRKHLFSLDLRNAEIIAPYGSPELEKVLPGYRFDKTIIACHDKPTDGTYGIVCEYMNKQTLVYFEPNETILRHLKNYARRAAVIRQEDLDKVTPSYWEKKEDGEEVL